jgi:integrase
MAELKARGVAESTRQAYAATVRNLAESYPKAFETIRREEIAEWLGRFTGNTLNSYGVIVKTFLTRLNGGKTPETIEYWKPHRVASKLMPESVLTEDDIHYMVDHAGGVMEKCLVHLTYDSGCRISEILSLTRQNVTFDKDGMGVLILHSSKTGRRRIKVWNATQILKTWVNTLPRDEPDRPVFPGRDGPLSYTSARRIILNAAKGLGNKKVNVHLLRHSRATMLCKIGVKEAAMRKQFGWADGSTMVNKYTHLSGEDTDAEIGRALGFNIPKPDVGNSPLKPVECPNCHTLNDNSMSFCRSCTNPLVEGKEFNTEYAAQVLADHLFPWPDEVGKLTAKEDDHALFAPDEEHKQVFEDLRHDRVEEMKTLIAMIQSLGKKPVKSGQ